MTLITNPSGSEKISCQGTGDVSGYRYARQVFDSISTIIRMAHQAIIEGALLRLKFSPLEEVTRCVYLG